MQQRGGLSMQENITRLIHQSTTKKPLFDLSLDTWFLLDKVRGKKTLHALFEQTESAVIVQIYPLLAQTKHDYLLDVSPLLIKLAHTELSDDFYKQLQRERSGIFIQSDQQILPHLQYLFTMQSELHGQTYVRYYDPIYWIALHLGLPESEKVKLWGNMLAVHTLAATSTKQQMAFNQWKSPEQLFPILYQVPATQIELSAQFHTFAGDIKKLYLVIAPLLAEYEMDLGALQLELLFFNINGFCDKGIDRIDYLQRLFDASMTYENLVANPDIKAILDDASLYQYEKIEQIEQVIQALNQTIHSNN